MRRILWSLLGVVGASPFFALLAGGLWLKSREGWLLSDWVAWTVLMAMLIHPILLGGLGLMILAVVKLRQVKSRLR